MKINKEGQIIRQFISFCIVGISNTIVGYIINISVLLTLRPFQVSWDYYAGNLVAFFLGVLWVFYWNNKFVFKQEDSGKRVWWKALLKTYVTYGITGLILTNIMSWIWVEYLDISKYQAPIFNLIITVPLNFLINKFWAFKGEK